MTPPALGPEIFSRGFRFNPTPQEAVSYYLPRLIVGEPLHEVVRSVINHADVYACEPADLARRSPPMPKTGDRFFFAPCKNQKAARAAGSTSSWAAQTTTEIKDVKDVQIGVLRKLRYKKDGVLTDWLMDECSSCGGGDGQQQFVFCKVYVSPRAPPNSAAHHESAAFFALPQLPPATVITHWATKRTTAPPPPQAAMPPCTPPQAAMPPCAKRTAPPPLQAAMPPCAKRMRGPVVQQAPQPPAPPAPIRTPLNAVRKLYFALPQPCAPLRCSPAPSVTRTQQSPAPIQAPAPPVLTRPVVEPRRSPMPAPPLRPMQQLPLPTPPMVQASCHMPQQASAPTLCQPQVSVQSKQTRILDPFEAAILRENAEDQTVPATPDPPPSNQFSAAAPGLQDDDDDDDDLVKALEEAMSTTEAEDQTMAPALQEEDEDDWDDLDKALGLEE